MICPRPKDFPKNPGPSGKEPSFPAAAPENSESDMAPAAVRVLWSPPGGEALLKSE